MKSLYKIFLKHRLIFIGLLTLACTTSAQTAPSITMRLVLPKSLNSTQQLTTISPLVFPAQQSDFQGSIVVDPKSDSTSHVTAKNGNPNKRAKADIIERSVDLQSTSSSNAPRIRVFGFRYGGDANNKGRFNYPQTPGESVNIQIGASLNVRGTPGPGNYTGNAHLEVTNDGDTATIPITIEFALMADNKITNERAMTFAPRPIGFTGTIVLSPTSSSAALFSATGAGKSSAVATVSPAEVTLLNGSYPDGIRVFAFRFASNQVNIDPITGAFHFPKGKGQTIIRDLTLGASASYPANLPEGTYSAVENLTISYL